MQGKTAVVVPDSLINILPLIGSCVFPTFFVFAVCLFVVVVGLTASSRVVHSVELVMKDRPQEQRAHRQKLQCLSSLLTVPTNLSF